MNEVTKKILQVHGTFSAPRGFARMLGCLLNKPKSTTSFDGIDSNGTATFKYKVPHTVCRNKFMPLSATMAVFDELSTVGLISLDKSHRWGVSVNLSTSLVRQPREGEDLVMLVKYNKMGKTLSFCEMALKDSKGDLVAIGNHTKFMPVSWLYDNFLSLPMILPIVLNLFWSFTSTSVKRTWLGKKYIPPAPEGENLESTADIEGILPSFAMQFNEAQGTFDFIARQLHCNPMSFHGGAAAMAAEEACVLAAERAGLGPDLFLKKLDMQYLSAINKSEKNLVSILVDKVAGSDGHVKGSLSQKGQGKMLFEAKF